MSTSSIDVSAQFGGRDAAAAVLPHFKALKAAAREVPLAGFPFSQLAFILRVDGEVNQYGLSGAGNVDIDPNGKYLSVDIGITTDDRGHIIDLIFKAFRSSSEQVRAAMSGQLCDIDLQALENCLSILGDRYKKELSDQLSG